MSYFLPDGAKLYMSTGFAAAKTATTVSNATPNAVVGSVAHGYTDGDEVLFTSGWEDVTDTVWRVDNKTTDTLELEGLDSSDTSLFAAGSGVGTLEEVSGWTELQQWLDSQDSGGGAKYVDVNPISRRNAIKLFAGFEAIELNLTFGYDPALASQIAMIAASRVGAKRAFKVVAPGPMVGYFYGNIAINEMPSLSKGTVMQARAAISVLGRFVSYTA